MRLRIPSYYRDPLKTLLLLLGLVSIPFIAIAGANLLVFLRHLIHRLLG